MPGLYPRKSTEVNSPKRDEWLCWPECVPVQETSLQDGDRGVFHGGETGGALISGWRGPGV